MSFFSALSSIATTGPLASRAYIPLFIIAFLGHNPGICDTLSIPHIVPPAGMEWLISDWFVTAVGILAVLEILADKNPEIQELLAEFEMYSKPICAALITLMVLPEDTVEQLDPYTQTAGVVGLAGALAMFNAALTWVLTGLRRSVIMLLSDGDPDDDIGARHILSWAEDLWATFGILICLIWPVLASIAVVFMLGMAIVWRLVAKLLDERSRVACPTCEHRVHGTAVACPNCHTELVPAKALNWAFWDGDVVWNAAGKQDHQLRLLSKRRCPSCAEHVKTRTLFKGGCEHCGELIESDRADRWFASYHAHLMSRGWKLMLPLTLVSLLPAVGFAVAVVSIKLMLAGPFKVFMGRGSKFLTRWGLRIFTLLLLIPASLPLVSILAVPILLLVHLWVYGGLARRAVRVAAPAAPAAAAPVLPRAAEATIVVESRPVQPLLPTHEEA